MTKERMLEYLILSNIIESGKYINEKYDYKKMRNRKNELKREFLEQYVINSHSKEQ